MIPNSLRFYINGSWVPPKGTERKDVVNPATEEIVTQVAIGDERDIDAAVAAARAAFASYSSFPPNERAELLEAIAAAYARRAEEIALAVCAEMGAPIDFARNFHAPIPISNFEHMAALLRSYSFESKNGAFELAREPIGVCGLITPWNAPVGQISAKVAPALAAGCTVVVKPSEFAPLSPLILAEVLDEAGVPAGVFNLVNGDGAAGAALSAHPDVDMLGFTGSTTTGIRIAQAAAPTVKRVHQELGGKSPNILLPDCDIQKWAEYGVRRCYVGSGQSCQAPTRMLVHVNQLQQATEVAKRTAESFIVGDPLDSRTDMGPVANQAQFEKVQALIAAGIEEGATLVTGGLGRPAGLDRGFFVKPTVFSHVNPRMRIAQEEIFGPVLSILPYRDAAEAIRIANDTVYGLAAWVCSSNAARAHEVAKMLRAGRVYINGASPTPDAPFGGYKRSGNGREGGIFGLEAYLERKAIFEPV